MSSGACKAVICLSQMRAVSNETLDFVALMSEKQQAQSIKIAEKAIHDLTEVAESIDAGDRD